MKVKFRDWNCNVIFKQYSNERIAITLDEIETGEPIAIATINLPNVPLAQDHVIIKDYSENEGMYNTLLSAGIISEEVNRVQTGFVTAPICKLLVSPYGDNKPIK